MLTAPTSAQADLTATIPGELVERILCHQDECDKLTQEASAIAQSNALPGVANGIREELALRRDDLMQEADEMFEQIVEIVEDLVYGAA